MSPLLCLDMAGCSSSLIKRIITIYLNTYIANGYYCYFLLQMAQVVEHRGITTNHANMELTQPRRLRQQKRHKFAYLTMKNNRFARFACALFIFRKFRGRSRSFHNVK